MKILGVKVYWLGTSIVMLALGMVIGMVYTY